MNTEWPADLSARAQMHAALGEPARLAIVDRLVMTDASPVELSRELGIPSNLLAHHITLLERAGLLTRSRSEADQRRTYLRLHPHTPIGLTPATRTAPRVLFVCTSNAARSQLAAALWRRRSTLPAASAGTNPADRVHPGAATAARRHGLDLDHHTQHLDQALRPGDLVIAVCDNAHERLGGQLGDRLHWAVADPARAGSQTAFDKTLVDLSDRVDQLALLVHSAEERGGHISQSVRL